MLDFTIALWVLSNAQKIGRGIRLPLVEVLNAVLDFLPLPVTSSCAVSTPNETNITELLLALLMRQNLSRMMLLGQIARQIFDVTVHSDPSTTRVRRT